MSTGTFGGWVKLRRRSLGLTQEQLAYRVGCAAVSLRKIESDERRPSLQLAQQLAVHLLLPEAEQEMFLKTARQCLTADRLPPANGIQDGPMAPSKRESPTRPRPLPSRLTRFIGRQRELDELVELLQRKDVRLVTLTGLGGVGKTSLALKASSLLADSELEIYFIDLSPVKDPALMLPMIAHSLRIIESGNRPLVEVLIDELQERQVLLVLDNFEQISPAAPWVGKLLVGTLHMKVLVTSRAALHLYGEYEYAVSPLPLPEPNDLNSFETLQKNDSVALFVDRVQLIIHTFTITPENAALVGEACRRLDGLPLLIELAAARLRYLSLKELLSQLSQPLSALANGPRDLPARQQSLHSVIQWTFQLLSPACQALFRRLSVFPGGWSLEEAVRVCYPDSSQESDAWLELQTLMEYSLLQISDPPSPDIRYRMPDILHAFAADQLQAAGEGDSYSERQAEYLCITVEQAESQLHSVEQKTWIQRLDNEYGNFNAALSWCEEHNVQQGLRLAGGLWRFWEMSNKFTDWKIWMDRLLSKPSAPTSWRAKALSGGAAIATYLGDYAIARQRLAESLEIARKLGDPQRTAGALNELGLITLYTGEPDPALDLFEQSLAIQQELGNIPGEAGVLNNLGLAALERGEADQASLYHQQSLETFYKAGSQAGAAMALGNLAHALHRLGNLQRAEQMQWESFGMFLELGDQEGAVECLERLALIECEQGDMEPQSEGSQRLQRAAQKLGCAKRVRQELSLPIPPTERAEHEHCLAVLAGRLEAEELRRFMQAGAEMKLSQFYAVVT